MGLMSNEEPPMVTLAEDDKASVSAADILLSGEQCQVVIVETLPLGTRSPHTGEDLYTFTLNVISETRAPYKIDIGNPVPKAAIPLLFAGNTLTAKRIPSVDDRMLAIDWDASLARIGATR